MHNSNQRKAPRSGPTRARVLLVDDHGVVRMGLRLMIERESDLTVCGEAENRAEALRLIERERPDLVVTDLCLTNESGLGLITDIADHYPQIRTVVLSMLRETVYAERVFQAGAMGYVMKQDPPETLVKALRMALTGECYVGALVAQQMARKMVNTGRSMRGTPNDLLADRELQVFEHMGEGLGPGDIARMMRLSVKTIGTYRERIKRKLGLATTRDLARHAVEWMRHQRGSTIML